MAGLRRIPDRVVAKVAGIEGPTLTVACSGLFGLADLTSGALASIGVACDGNVVTVPGHAVIPGPEGPVSGENVNGREVVHRDEPKITREFYMGDRPIYGDWRNGSFSLWADRQVYRRSFIAPRGLRISTRLQGVVDKAARASLSFSVEPSLDRHSPAFEVDLLFALSLLREVVGCCDVFESDTDPGLLQQAQRLEWEIFPPGERDLRRELERRLDSATPDVRERLLSRADVIESLNPARHVLGTGLSSDYYGALFEDDLVVFENLEYGNATYVLYEEWEALSQLSRTELLQSGAEYTRLIHDGSWEKQLRELVKHERRKRRWRR